MKKYLTLITCLTIPVASQALPQWNYIPPVDSSAAMNGMIQAQQQQQQAISQFTNAITQYAEAKQRQKELEHLNEVRQQIEDERKALLAEQKAIKAQQTKEIVDEYYARTPHVIVTDEQGNHFRCLEGHTNIAEDICHYVDD